MTTLSLRLPSSIHAMLAELAQRDGISINQFINSAVAEKIAALATEKYLEGRSKRANIDLFKNILTKIPFDPPLSGDEILEDQCLFER